MREYEYESLNSSPVGHILLSLVVTWSLQIKQVSIKVSDIVFQHF